MEQENQKAIDNAMFKKLQELAIKMPSDPILYKQDVEKYKGLFMIEFQKLQGDTMKKNQRFGELLIFLAKSVRFFPDKLGFIPTTTMSLMNELGKSLHHYVRKKCISAIMILRAKNILYPISTIQFLLKQFNIQDKQLRKILYKYIVNDIRRMNKHHKNNQINQQLKKFISQYIIKYSDKTAQKSLQVMIELYKKNIWTDNRTVNIIADGCFNASVKIRLIACHFLVSTTQPIEELSDSQEEDFTNPSDIKWIKGIKKHTKNKDKKLQKEKKKAQRRLKKKQIGARKQNFMPIDLIYSPQDFAEKLFNLMNHKQTKFNHKLIYMSLISRIIWRHKLIMLPFYGALQKYMDPRQKQSPRVLAYFAQSVHQLVPDDQLQPIVKYIIQTFVNDKCSQFAMTVGLNTIREVFSKCPSIITQQAMTYLCTYYQYRNKNVTMAAKSVINLVRGINPYLLQKKFRGKNNNQALSMNQMLKQVTHNRIKGAQLLNQDQNDLPIQMTKILSDDDFKKIRKLMRKKQQQDGWGDIIQQNHQQNENENQNQEVLEILSEDIENGQEEQCQDDQSQLSSQNQQQDEDDGEELDWGDSEEVEIDDQDQQLENQQDQEIDENQEIDEDQQDLQMLSGDQEQEDQQKEKQIKSKKKKKNNTLEKTKKIQKTEKQPEVNLKRKKKNAQTKKQQALQSDSDDYQQSEEQNPHGFIDVHRIAFYKKSKTEIKAQKRRNPELKQKFKHKPKEKKGGSTNEQKNKMKPIMMLRDKKNKSKLRQKQVKLRIKSLKTQLGKVRSGKQAKKLKNKKIKK